MLRSILILFVLAALVIGCNKEEHFQVGQCVQEPDSIDIWKIADIKGVTAKLQLVQGMTLSSGFVEINLNEKNFVKTECSI